MRGQNGLMRVVATRIEPDGAVQRRMVDTAQQSDRRLWEDLAARAIGVPVPYRPAPGIAVYHLSVDDYVVMAASTTSLGHCWTWYRRDGIGRRMLERGISLSQPRARRSRRRSSCGQHLWSTVPPAE